MLRNIFSIDCKTSDDRNNLTRVYVISNDPIIASNKTTEDNSIVVDRTSQRGPQSCTTNSTELHVPVEDEGHNATERIGESE